MKSPEITNVSWGQLEVADRNAPLRDAKLFPGGSRAWDWNETGTRHHPGVQPADLEELLDRGAVEVVVGLGMHERLAVTAEARALLEARGVTLHMLQTEAAVRRYNELARSQPVGALIHSTC